MRRRVAFLTAALALAALSTGLALAQEVPTIYLYVNDLADPGALLRAEEAALDDLCYEVDSLTSAEIAVLIVNTTAPQGIDLYAVETFERNGVGKEGLDNGVLILISIDERQWRIEVGYGLEWLLTDAFVGEVGTTYLAPAFEGGDYFTGLYDATLAIGQTIVDNYEPGPGGPPQAPQLFVIDWTAVAIIAAILVGMAILTRGRIFLWTGGLFSIFRRGGFGGGRSGGGGARGRFR